MAGYVRKTFAAVKAAALMLIFMFCLVPEVSAQTEAPVLDSGNTAWILTSSLLVLLMSIPGIALFYGGLVRQKNVLSIIMQTLFIVGVVSILWIAFGYSWAFDTSFSESGNPLAFLIGGFDKAFLSGISIHTLTAGNIPELTFVMFQCMFAIITPALILGAFAERIKFSGYILFITLWVILAYFPMAHWVWGGGFLQQMGAIDFAGGTVVHINAGISALVMAVMLGKRMDYRIGHPITPHNVTFVFMGTSFLWMVWLQCGQWPGCRRIGCQCIFGYSCSYCCSGDYMDGCRLDMQQEAYHNWCVYRCRCRTCRDYSCGRNCRSAWCILHRYCHACHLFLHGSRNQA